MLISWKDSFAIDHGVIDDDHRFLIAAINSLIDEIGRHAVIEAFLPQVLRLRAFAELHFRREERLQEQCGFPGQAGHRAEHQRLLSQLDLVVETLRSAPQGTAPVDTPQLRSFFFRWILGHILEEDIKMKSFLAQAPQHGEVALARLIA